MSELCKSQNVQTSMAWVERGLKIKRAKLVNAEGEEEQGEECKVDFPWQEVKTFP